MKKNFYYFLIFSFLSLPASAADFLNFNFLDPNLLNGVLPQNVANEAIKMFGIYAAHRPYSGATSIIKSNTVDLNVEATLVKIGPGLFNALRDDGLGIPPFTTPAVPMAKLNLRKAMSEKFDVGVSGLGYRNNLILGGDFKFVLHDPEEGPSFALRLGYTYIKAPYAYIKNISVISPELVVSRRLYFAEPYLGIGGRYMTGTVAVPFQITTPVAANFTLTKTGTATTGYVFTGVYFRILSAQGLRMGIEGSFDLSGYHTIGGVFGVGF